MTGTIVYVHGASDRGARVDDHVRAIREALSRRGARIDVIAARWGDDVGPTLERILEAVPETRPREKGARPATKAPMQSRLLQALGAAIVAAEYVGIKLPRPARIWATDRLLYRRDDLMLEILGVADALVYQRAGDRIRSSVRAVLEAVPDDRRPLIAVGNSLGGIILVDVLREPGGPRPDLLATVGSQSGALQAFGALGEDPAPPFQPWLNIFDRRDFVGFLARPMWPDAAGIVDRQVDLGRGFPEVHGPAYFEDQQVWDAVLGHPSVAPVSG